MRNQLGKLWVQAVVWGVLTVSIFLTCAAAPQAIGMNQKCWASTFCDCTMYSHMMQRWCGGTGMSSWCYSSNHYCTWGGFRSPETQPSQQRQPHKPGGR